MNIGKLAVHFKRLDAENDRKQSVFVPMRRTVPQRTAGLAQGLLSGQAQIVQSGIIKTGQRPALAGQIKQIGK